MQKGILISSFIIFVFSLSSCTISGLSGSTGTGVVASGEAYQRDLDPEKKLELLKKRRKEINSVRKGDYYTIKNNPGEALTYYLQVAEKLPDDVIIQKKIAHAYYLQKEWRNAYHYFTNVPFTELSESEQKEMLSSLFFDESETDKLGELYKIPTGTGMQEYYPVVNTCYSGIHDCVVKIESYAGSGQKLNQLKKTSIDAAKVSPDFHYRNFAIAAKFYEFGDFLATEKLTREILDVRPDYDEVRKLQGFALFELGRYNEAKTSLLQYLEKQPKDIETVVKLGEISAELKDYVTSNLYLNNAILAGYTPKTNLERRLAYNYSLLGDTVGMMKVLSYLVQEHDASEDDFSVAISLALSQGENLRALVWAGEGIKIHPNSFVITPLYITSLRVLGKTKDAEMVIDSLSQELAESPLIALERGILLFDKEWYDEARFQFKKVLAIDDTADFAVEAQNYIDEIEVIKAEEAAKNQNTIPVQQEEKGWWW